MAKTIEGQNGERIIVSDDTPDDIQYGATNVQRFLAARVQKEYTGTGSKSIIDPVALLLSFDEQNYPDIPVHLIDFSKKPQGRLRITGTMLSADFAFLLEKDIDIISRLTIGLENKSFEVVVGAPYKITSLRAKGMNAVAVRVDLSLKKTT